MLLAVAEDLARDGGFRVVTTWDRRLPAPRWPDGLEVRIVAGQTEEATASEELARNADTVWIIAPECDDVLGRRLDILGSQVARPFNCSAAASRLCGDKLRLAEWLSNRGVPTPETVAATPAATASASGWTNDMRGETPPILWPIVVKPRDGAGSQSTFVVSGPGLLPPPLLGWETVKGFMEAEPWKGGWIAQPFLSGRSLSLAAIIRSQKDFDLLPAGEQHLSRDGRLGYCGGTIPATEAPVNALETIVSSVIERMEGLSGWVGFDLLVPDDHPDVPILIEINPRLTTSYIGYRALTGKNLARRIASGAIEGGRIQPFATASRSAPVRFRADGTLERPGDRPPQSGPTTFPN